MKKDTSPKNGQMHSGEVAGMPGEAQHDAKGAAPIKQRTLLRIHLRPDRVYRCVLSGLPMLVIERNRTGPDPKDMSKEVTRKERVGYYYNPLYGAYQTTELRDHQLVDFNTNYGHGIPL